MILYFLPFILTFFFAELYDFQRFSFHKSVFLGIILVIGLFGGLRYETGQDWEAYTGYFENIDISYGMIESYFSNLLNLNFEIGYFFLNYIVKYVGLDFWVLFLFSSLFCSYSLYTFTNKLAGNKFYILIIYISYSFLLLQFAQVRQAIALSFFLLGCSNYLKTGNKKKALIIGVIGLIFQFSGLIYILLLLIVFYYPKGKKSAIILFLFLPLLFLIINYFGAFSVLKLFAPVSLENKLDIYEEEQVSQGIGQLFYGVYIMFCVIYIYYNMRKLYFLTTQELFVCKYALFSLSLTVVSIFLFAGNYVMYSRLYLIASIFQGFAISIILNYNRTIYHKLFFNLSILIAFVYYYRIISIQSDQYLPYRSWFHTFFN
jgi:transmembrane protein EpsG